VGLSVHLLRSADVLRIGASHKIKSRQPINKLNTDFYVRNRSILLKEQTHFKGETEARHQQPPPPRSGQPIQAFTLTFDQAAYDEGDIAREMAARAVANFHPVPIKQSDIADNFAERAGIRKRCSAETSPFRRSQRLFLQTDGRTHSKAVGKSAPGTRMRPGVCAITRRRLQLFAEELDLDHI
jgi:hypothetical protein